jgi:ABC-type cobalamin/Fe3+-siderophores transport system ATPase subunit
LVFFYETKPVLEHISFSLIPGQILALLGPNGAGKSTLLKFIDGLLRPRKGGIELDGRANDDMQRKEIARSMAYVPQAAGELFPFKAIDMVLLLDEPTSNLDIRHQLEVMDLLQRLVKTDTLSAIITMHDLNLAARYSDTAIVLDRGRIVASGRTFRTQNGNHSTIFFIVLWDRECVN